MQEQVKEILEMTKNGHISVEEASRLIEALNKKTATTEQSSDSRKSGDPKEPWGGIKMDQDLDSIGKFVEKLLSIPVLKKSIESATKTATIVAKNHRSTMLSQLEEPVGESFSFEDNSFNLSTFSSVSLSHSAFCDNSLNASSLQVLAMERSEMNDCAFNGTSLDHVHLTDATMNDTSFSGSRVRSFSIQDSKFNDLNFSGCSLRDVVISQKTDISDCSINNLQLQQCELKKNRWSDCNFHAVTIESSQLDAVEFADMSLSKITIVDCVIRNVALSDIKLEAKELRGLTIDGTESFLRVLDLKA